MKAKSVFLIFLLVQLLTVQVSACTMEPSLWNTIETSDQENGPGGFALSDALFQLREKLVRELSACGLPVLPLTFVGAFSGKDARPMSPSDLEILEQSVKMIFADASILPAAELLDSPEDFAALQKASDKAGKKTYTALVQVSDARSSFISQIDSNFWLYHLYRCVLREEIKIFLRVADASGAAIFIDEITVSPTIIIDPLVSPVGGYIVRFEKNSASPLMLDFGPLSDGGEHVLRVNDAFRQPTPTPPLPEFSRPAALPGGDNTKVEQN